MTPFTIFKEVIIEHLDLMFQFDLFKVDVDKDVLWNVYLNSFPEGTNPMYKERTEHDCQCCKQFIRNIGGVVYIKNNALVSVWETVAPNFFQQVMFKLAEEVHKHKIKSPYLHYEYCVGTDHNHQLIEDATPKRSKRWEHLYYKLHGKFVAEKSQIPTILGDREANKNVFKRALEEISVEAIETVLELIEQNSIYRGEENKSIVKILLDCKKTYIPLDTAQEDIYAWQASFQLGTSAKVKNTAIGVLLTDISEDMTLDEAVRKFEAMVAPTNYKRPTALITKSMIAKAEKKVKELGIQDSLQRRYAVVDDISINNVIFADRIVKKAKGVFDDLADSIAYTNKNFDKIKEVTIDKFLKDILPKSTSIEVMLENKHTSNLVSLIAPENGEAKPILKWGNNYSWSYNGEVTDSIKERVKSAGGNVTGILRCSLGWYLIN